MSKIPATYEEWSHCIQVKCKIPLTPEFARQRIAFLEDTKSTEAIQFERLYGETHRTRVIEWFRRVSG